MRAGASRSSPRSRGRSERRASSRPTCPTRPRSAASPTRPARSTSLVNNAGISWFGPTADLDVATYDALFDSNVRAAYFLVAALAPRMAARGGGSIVNVASMVATVGIAGAAAYGGTKATLAAMTRSWAAEFSPRGVRVNTVAPGPVYTAADPARIEALGATTLLGRAARADEIAQVITFLASPASAYVTGATVAADGGRTAV